MRAVALTLLAALAGCAQRTELLVVLQSDVAVPADADELALRITRADEPLEAPALFERSYLLPSEASLPASLDLTTEEEEARVTIVAALRKGGVLQIERKATLPFAPVSSRERIFRRL